MKKFYSLAVAIALVVTMASSAFAWTSNSGFSGFADRELDVAIASDTISVGNLLVLDLAYSGSYMGIPAGQLSTYYETGCVVKRSPATAEVADTDQIVIGVALQAAVPGQSVTYVSRGKVQVLFNYTADSGASAVAGTVVGASATAGYVGNVKVLTNSATATTDLNVGARLYRKLGILLENVTADGLAYMWLDLRR